MMFHRYEYLKSYLASFKDFVNPSEEELNNDENGEMDFSKCLLKYEFNVLFHNGKLNQEEMARAMQVHVSKFATNKFEKHFGFPYPEMKRDRKYYLHEFCNWEDDED
jgi:hypothetical protein